jgi:uncharacterized protein DUF4926
MFDEYEVVKLTADLPDENLKAGARGTVLIILEKITPIQHYIVEFMDDDMSLGTPIVPETLLERCVELRVG